MRSDWGIYSQKQTWKASADDIKEQKTIDEPYIPEQKDVAMEGSYITSRCKSKGKNKQKNQLASKSFWEGLPHV